MMYFYKDDSGSEVGPLEQSVVESAIAEGVVRADTEMRTDLLKTWKKAAEFRVFARHFEAGGDGAQAQERQLSFRERFAQEKKQSTAFVPTHTPKDASCYTRICALILDAVVLALIAGVVYGGLFFLPLRARTTLLKSESAPAPAPEAVITAEKPQATVAVEEKNGKAAASAGKSAAPEAQGGVRKLFPSLAKAEKANAERNAEINNAATEGAAKKDGKKDGKALKLKKTLSGSWEVVDENPQPVKSNQTDKVDELAGRAKEALGEVVVPEFRTDKVSVERGFVLREHGETTRSEIPLASYRFHLHLATLVFLVAVFLYYSLLLGYYAQTVGMWYYGIFLTRRSIREAGYLRCFCYTVALLLFGILMIPAVFFSGRSVADWLCGVRVINVYGASKAK